MIPPPAIVSIEASGVVAPTAPLYVTVEAPAFTNKFDGPLIVPLNVTALFVVLMVESPVNKIFPVLRDAPYVCVPVVVIDAPMRVVPVPVVANVVSALFEPTAPSNRIFPVPADTANATAPSIVELLPEKEIFWFVVVTVTAPVSVVGPRIVTLPPEEVIFPPIELLTAAL